MQMVIDVFAQIFGTLWAHKLRSFLTMFGIAWGVGSLLLLVGLGEGFRTGNKRNLSEYGENIIMMFPGRAPAVPGSMNSAREYRLTYQDYLDIRKESPHIRAITPILSSNDARAVSEYASASGQLNGAEPQYTQIRFLPLKQGRWLNDLDEVQKRRVVVLGDEMTHHLFPGRPAIGSFILINGYRFEVIGTLQRVGRGDENLTNTRAYIPFQVMRSDFPLKGEESYDAISFIYYQPHVADEHLLAQNEARRVVARNHHFDYHDEDAFEGINTVQQAQSMGAIFDAMDEFLGTVGMITLALGAIGVINIMLIAVTAKSDCAKLSAPPTAASCCNFSPKGFCSRWSADSLAWLWRLDLWRCSGITTVRKVSIRRGWLRKPRSSPSAASLSRASLPGSIRLARRPAWNRSRL